MEKEPLLTAFRKVDTRRYYSTPLELTLDRLAYILLFLGIAACGLVSVFSMGDPRFFLLSVTPCTLGVIVSLAQWGLLRGLAEILRLLKKQSSLSFSGCVTGESFQEVFSCSNCGCMLHSESSCDVCGAQIAKEVAKDAYAT